MFGSGLLPTFERVRSALRKAQQSNNGGLGNHMWATLVDRSGLVVAVAYSGEEIGDQWPGSRLISAAKASTANGLSLDTMAISTANLYAGSQPGGSLFGLPTLAPINVVAAYAGDGARFGTAADPLVGKVAGGVVVFGGGLAIYSAEGKILGGLGVSGDLSCADHNIAWKLRRELELDFVPNGLNARVPSGNLNDDNIIYDIDSTTGKSSGGWGHPACSSSTQAVSEGLATTHPLRLRR